MHLTKYLLLEINLYLIVKKTSISEMLIDSTSNPIYYLIIRFN